MAQTRKRNYRSRRERFRTVYRNTKIFIIFALIFLAVWIFKARHELWNWYSTYFY